MGSGKLLKYAIKKYGAENFVTEILEVYDQEWKMNLAEKILVVLDPEVSYNLCKGGHGGFGYINNNKLGVPNFTKTNAKYISKLGNQSKKDLSTNNPTWKEKVSKNISLGLKGRQSPFKGRKHSEETKTKMSQADRSGPKNSQFGKPRSEETKRKIRETLLKKKLMPL